MKRKLAFLTALVVSVNLTAVMPMVANAAAISDLSEYYTVGKDYILGLEADLTAENFEGKVGDNAIVYEANGTAERTGIIQNGDILEVGGVQYTLQTEAVQDRIIFNDTFESDADKAKWTGSPMNKLTTDAEKGNVMSWDRINYPGANTFTSTRKITEAVGTGDTLIFEFDVQYPTQNGDSVTLLLFANNNERFANLRLFKTGEFGVLKFGGTGMDYVKKGVTAGAEWHHAKYVLYTKTGKMDIEIDNDVNIQGKDSQVLNKPQSQYIPSRIELSAGSMPAEGAVIALDNVVMYEPKPIQISGLSWLDGNTENKDMTAVSVGNTGFKVYFNTDENVTLDKENVEASVALYNGTQKLDADVTYDAREKSCTIISNVLLNNETDYTIKVAGITEGYLNTSYNDAYTFTTDSVKMPFVLKNITAEANGEILTDLLNLTTKTEKINLYFNVQTTTEIDTTDIENRIKILDANQEPIDISGAYIAADKCYEITLNTPMTANTRYYIVIDGLTDTVNAVPYSKQIEIRAIPSWVADAGDIAYSDVYNVTSDQITGIACGTDIVTIWEALNVLPGSKVAIYTDGLLQELNKGLILDGNVLVVENDTLEISKQYTLKTTGVHIVSDVYNIGDDYIMNVSENTEVADFISNITIHNASDYGVYKNGKAKTTGVMENGDIFKLKSGSVEYSYNIKTHKHDNTYYVNDDFEDGTTGAWTNGDIIPDADLGTGNVISWTATGATATQTASIKAERAIDVKGTPDILIWETDFKANVDLKNVITYYARCANVPNLNTILANIRIDNMYQLGALVPGKAETVCSLDNKWYHARYVMDCKAGAFDTYINGKLMKSDLKYQATTGDYIPAKFEVGTSGLKENGFVLALDNVQVYEPNPVKVNSLSFHNGAKQSFNMNNVATDTDNIQLKISCEDEFAIKNIDQITDCVKLVNKDGDEIKTEKKYDSNTGVFTITPTDGLEKDSKYTVEVNGIIDDVYRKAYNDSFDFYTNGDKAIMKKAFLVNSVGDIVEGLSSDKFDLYMPVVNTGAKKELNVILVLYNEQGRVVKCMTTNVSAEEKSLAEASFTLDLGEAYTNGMYAKAYLKESGNGPLAKPYVIK